MRDRRQAIANSLRSFQGRASLLRDETFLEQVRGRGPLKVAIVYPNTYHVGMSNLGIQWLYKELNTACPAQAERAFAPSDGHQWWQDWEGPVRTLESGTPLNCFDVIAFSIPFEGDYLNVLPMLDACGITLRARERNGREPLILAGGPAVTLNPEPVADFFDAIVIGDGEPVVRRMFELILEHDSGRDRQALLGALALLPGVYVPALHSSSNQAEAHEDFNGLPGQTLQVIERSFAPGRELKPARSLILTPHTEFSDMFLVEVGRGCPHRCRFCTVGYAERPPRFFRADLIWEAVEPNLDRVRKVGLLGAVVSDHPRSQELAWRIVSAGKQLTMASLRMDTLSESLIAALAQGRGKNLTIAPEAGTEKLRFAIGKPISDDKMFEIIGYAQKYGIEQVKLYLMIGLPFETDQDVVGIAELSKSLLKNFPKLRFQISCSIFVPKPHTPFQWAGMCQPEILERRRRMLWRELRGQQRLKLSVESVRWAMVQTLLAQGDRRMASVISRAYELGGNFAAWKRAVDEKLGRQIVDVVCRKRSLDEKLPWAHVDVAIKRQALAQELTKATEAVVASG